MATEPTGESRRELLRRIGRMCMLGLIGAVTALLHGRKREAKATEGALWQIDPTLCNQCGRCATACVLTPSAVKCVHAYEMCGYCKLCFGFFQPGAKVLDEGAENQICPTGAIRRGFVEPPYYQYVIEEELCIGCAKCVKTCTVFGNGSLFMQIRHDRCINCNECAIEPACPAGAVKRRSGHQPYLLKGGHASSREARQQGAPAPASTRPAPKVPGEGR